MDIGLWGLDINHKGRLVAGGCDLVDLANTYGTPLHVVDEQRLRSNYRSFLRAFQAPYPNVKVFYSYKTNCVPGVLSVLHNEGCGAEVTSPYEMWLAAQLNVPATAVVYNGVNKSVEDLERAIQAGIGLINIDSVNEARLLQQTAERLQRPVNVGIRLEPGLGWKAQFGIQPSVERFTDVLRELRSTDALRVRCLHAHIGSQVRNAELYRRTIETLIRRVAELKTRWGIDMDAVDLGGGFGVPTVKSFTAREAGMYKLFNAAPTAPGLHQCSSVEEFGKILTETLKECCRRHGVREPMLLLEPGRVITSSSQMLLVSVRDLKKRKRKTFALTDGGMQNVAFPLSYEYHHCLVANRVEAPRNERYFVTGPLCSPQDLLYRNWKLPRLECGDVLAIMDAGAYFVSFSNTFSYPRPAVVMVSNGTSRLIRARETFAQMTAGDQLQADCADSLNGNSFNA